MTLAVLAGMWMVLQTSPFIIWLAGSVFYLINQGIGCIQIMRINNTRLHPEFHIGRINWVDWPFSGWDGGDIGHTFLISACRQEKPCK